MINLTELEQFVAFGECKTLHKVSELFHISSPSVTRSMKNIEKSFGVSLFNRSSNKIELNETGKKAVELSKNLLEETVSMIESIKKYDSDLKTISIKSCAPMPLWKLMPKISLKFPEMTISSNILTNEDVLSAIKSGDFDIGILPFEPTFTDFYSHKFITEKLYISVIKEHELADKASVSFDDINGFNFLLRDNLGFWYNLCREKMPSSKFLIQRNDFEFEELVKTSSLPHFITNLTEEFSLNKHNRLFIPITDTQGTINFHLVFRDKNLFKNIFN